MLDGAPSDEPLFRRFYCAELTRYFKHPDTIPAGEYVWVTRFREHGERLASINCGIGLEFRDGWATGRILVLGGVVIVGMVALTIVWIVLGGDYGQVCNVMSFAMGTFTGTWSARLKLWNGRSTRLSLPNSCELFIRVLKILACFLV